MSLEKLQQEAEALQALASTDLTPEQLSELLEKLSSLIEESEQSLVNTSLIELNKIEDTDEDTNEDN
jgi:hypothetical protein